MRRLGPLALVLFVALAFLLGRAVRAEMDVGYTAESVRAYVHGLGLVAPLVFVVMLAFRQFLLLPSMLLLTVGGLVFGAPLGTALGTLGITLSGAIGFFVARGLGRERVQRYLGARVRDFEQRMRRAGLAVVALMTAHPMGLMAPFHWGAGFTSVGALPFLLAVGLGALVRSFAYSLFGAALLEPGNRVYLAMALLALAAVAPLAHPGLRRRLLASPEPEGSPSDQ